MQSKNTIKKCRAKFRRQKTIQQKTSNIFDLERGAYLRLKMEFPENQYLFKNDYIRYLEIQKEQKLTLSANATNLEEKLGILKQVSVLERNIERLTVQKVSKQRFGL